MRNKSHAIIAELYNKYGGMVFRRCMKLLRNHQDALDCMQDVFMHISSRKIDVIYPSAYLYKIATNLCLNRIRDRNCHCEQDIDDFVVMVAVSDDSSDSTIKNLIIDKIFNGHPESTRVIALLHFYDGFTLEEVGKMVNMSVSGVRKRLQVLKESAKKRGLNHE